MRRRLSAVEEAVAALRARPAGAFDWDPAHAAPAYFQCESCGSRFKSFDGGPLAPASGQDDDRHFRPGSR